MRRSSGTLWAVLLAALAFHSVVVAQSISRGGSTAIELRRITSLACTTQGGWTNIFFEPSPDSPGDSAAVFADGPPDETVWIVRRRGQDGRLDYTTRVGRTKNGRQLRFQPTANGECATTYVRLPGVRDSVRIQVSTAEQWAYGRVAEYREGLLPTADGTLMRVELHPSSRNDLWFNRVDRLELYIDQDRSGSIRRRSELTNERAVLVDERLGQRFRLGNKYFEVDSINAGAWRLIIRPIPPEPGPYRGFPAPLLVGADADGTRQELAGGRIAVIEFWSTGCPWSEQVRPEAARLAAAVESLGGQYLAMPREPHGPELQEHLKTHPRGGRILTHDAATWKEWNPETATPLFYVISADGTILLREYGSAAARLAAAAIGLDPAVIR